MKTKIRKRSFFGNLLVLLAMGIHACEARAPQKLLSSESARRGELKYQVSLKIRNYNQCGGALISEKHVLTAAHCFVGRLDPPYTNGLVLVTGATSLVSGGEHHYAKHVKLHPEYVKGNGTNRWRHDIAVVTAKLSGLSLVCSKLVTPAVKNDFQAPVALPSSDTRTKVIGVVSGWGQMQRGQNAQYPNDLRKRNVTILNQADCNSRNRILDTQMCGFDGENTGFCHGDSGGPLVYNNEVIGIVSFAIRCGIGYPDVYTRVWPYKNFITDAMRRQ